ncbi:MAG: hypothetical protein EOS34_22935 [Mesorhizobium sp.]|nr:MAG: hypothetical protein EOS34_22935 [Mesorhizobium sp.]
MLGAVPMSKFTILHLSDLHWASSKANDMRIIVDGLVSDLEESKAKRNKSANMIAFSGDLVQAGEDPALFQDAKTEFIDKVLKATGLNSDRMFFVPGNHDIQRKAVREAEYIEAGLQQSLSTVDKVNAFVDSLNKRDLSVLPALVRMGNFDAFIGTLSSAKPVSSSPLLKTYLFNCGGSRVGVACFNSAWRSTGEPDDRDRRQMLLVERNVDIAISDIKEAEIRVAMFHHPFDWLAEFDETAVSSRLMSQFDVLLCGHIHRSSPEARVTSAGSAIISQTGCLYHHRKHFNGYQFITIDLGTRKVEFDIRSWFDTRRTFDTALDVAPNGSLVLDFSPRTQPGKPSLDGFLQEIRPIVRENAAQHINISDTLDVKLGAKDAFICPPLVVGRSRPEIDAAEEMVADPAEKAADEASTISAEDLLRSTGNFLIVGSRETGKSSLAHYMAVLCAEGTSDQQRIPIYIDYRLLKPNLYGFKKAIGAYLSTTKTGLDVESTMKDGDFLFLLDNFDGSNIPQKKELLGFVEKYPNVRWIFYSDERFGGLDPKNPKANILPDFKYATIQQLPRKSIRELAHRWCDQTGADTGKTFSTVMAQIQSGNLPRTGYMVTLLLWALHQEKKFERINEAVLLTNMVDYLLGKADFTKALRREFDPTAKEIVLQSLSAFLKEKGDFALKDEVTEFLISFFKQKGLRYAASDVLNGMLDCGILSETDGKLSFKYRCFQEYFYANLLRNDPSLLDEHTRGFEFVNYSRELDLLSGLRRQNGDLLNRISSALATSAPSILSGYDSSDFDAITEAKSALGVPTKQIADIRKKRLTSEQIDDMRDAADRRLAKKAQSRKPARSVPQRPVLKAATDEPSESKTASPLMSPPSYLVAISLLGKVVKNSEFNDADEKVKATRFYIDCVMHVCLLYCGIMDDILSEDGEDDVLAGKLNGKEREVVKYILKKVVIQAMLEQVSDEIGTEKLYSIYERIINSNDVNSFEAVAVNNILYDLSHPGWLEYWRRSIAANQKREFILNLMVEKIWKSIHTRPISDGERIKVEKITDEIERMLGFPKVAKGRLLEKLRTSVQETNKRLDGD